MESRRPASKFQTLVRHGHRSRLSTRVIAGRNDRDPANRLRPCRTPTGRCRDKSLRPQRQIRDYVGVSKLKLTFCAHGPISALTFIMSGKFRAGTAQGFWNQ